MQNTMTATAKQDDADLVEYRARQLAARHADHCVGDPAGKGEHEEQEGGGQLHAARQAGEERRLLLADAPEDEGHVHEQRRKQHLHAEHGVGAQPAAHRVVDVHAFGDDPSDVQERDGEQHSGDNQQKHEHRRAARLDLLADVAHGRPLALVGPDTPYATTPIMHHATLLT